MEIFSIVIRVLHIGSAILAAGGAAFQYIALLPAAAELQETPARALRERIAARWRGVVFTAVLLLLATGLLNFLIFKVPEYRGTSHVALYHGLFGLKLLLALIVFHPATLLVLPGPKGEIARAAARGWLGYMLVLFTLIVVLGAVLREFPNLFVQSSGG